MCSAIFIGHFATPANQPWRLQFSNTVRRSICSEARNVALLRLACTCSGNLVACLACLHLSACTSWRKASARPSVSAVVVLESLLLSSQAVFAGRVKNAEILPWALWHEIPPSSPLPDKLEVSHISVTRRDLAASDAPLEHAAWSQLASLKPAEALQSCSNYVAESHATPPSLAVPRGTDAAPAPWPVKQSSKQVAHSTSPPAADLLDQHHAPTQHAFFPESLQHSAPQVPPPPQTHHAANVVTSADGSLDAACSLSSAASFDTSDVSETSASSGPGCTEDLLLLAAARKRTDTCASAQRCSCDTVEVSAARSEQRRAASEAIADSGGREVATSGGTQVKPRPDPNAECEFVVMELLGRCALTPRLCWL